MRTYYARLSPEDRRAKFVDGRDLERVREHDRERYRQHPEKFKARNAVLRAVRRGDLARQPCERCGTTDNVEAHHDDYDRPLEVRWLCRRHHVDEHTAEAA
jgi:ribosomal protein S27AE